MKRIKENGKLIWLTVFILITTILAILVIFNVNKQNIDDKVSSYTKQYLTDIMNENADRIASKLENNFTTLEVLANFIGQSDDVQSQPVVNMLNQQFADINAVRYDVVTKEGKGLGDRLEVKDMLKQPYSKQAFNGANTISDISTSLVDGSQVVIFSVPIVSKNGGIPAILQGVYDVAAFSELVGDSVFSSKADTFIAQQDGNLVTKPDTVNSTNIFTLLNTVVSGEQAAVSDLEKQISKGDTGILIIGSGKYKRYICYTDIPENNWYSITIMSYSAVEKNISDVSNMGVGIGQAVIVLFLLLTIYMLAIYIRSNMKVRLGAVRYKIVAEQSENVIFEINNHTGYTEFNEKWVTKFGRKNTTEDFQKEIKESGVLYGDDMETFESAFEELRSGKDTVNKELRLYNQNHKIIWHMMSLTALRDRKGQVSRIIGRFTDIDRSKREIEYFKEQSQLDLATGLYNKETSNYKVGLSISSLKRGMLGALLYIDIDDFKEVNDQFGHNFGDHLIRKLTMILRDVVGDNSFAGRVGGDEFIVMIENIYDISEAMKMGDLLMEKAEQVEFPHHPGVRLKISIGIAIAPDDGNNPQSLLKSADMAMFQAKKQGKHCAVLTRELE